MVDIFLVVLALFRSPIKLERWEPKEREEEEEEEEEEDM